MKKFALMSFSFAGICLSAFVSSVDFPINLKSWENSCSNLQLVNVSHLTDHDLNEIMQGHHPEIAVEFSAQTVLPISFFLKGDLINFVENKEKLGHIEIKQTFYVRCKQGELILSTNLNDWKPLLEFITGNARIELSIQEGKPSIIVGAEANCRS